MSIAYCVCKRLSLPHSVCEYFCVMHRKVLSFLLFSADLEKAIEEFKEAATELDATAQETDGE